MMDIALAVDKILPGAAYRGSVTANTKAAWNAVVWQDARRKKPSWQELEAAAVPDIEEARAAKLAEIVTKANEVKAALSSRFSALEEGTWPEQEAGARSFLGDVANVKDKTARLILLDETAAASARKLVALLADADNSSAVDFSRRIVANADMSYQAGIGTLMEQRALEAAVHRAETVEEVEAVEVVYSVMAMLTGEQTAGENDDAL